MKLLRTEKVRTILLFVIAATVACAASGGTAAGGVVVTVPEPGWATASQFNRPQVDLICAGRFVRQPVRMPANEGTQTPTSYSTVEAGFRIDSVVKGPQEMEQQTISVRYLVLDYLLPDGPKALDPGQPIGSAAFRDVTATVAGRRCLLLLREHGKEPETYDIFRGFNFMVAGQKPQVAGWADLEPMERLECEFASAVQSPDPAVAYLATLSATMPYSKAVGPALLGALRQNTRSADRRLQVASVAGLVRLNDLDTIYELKDIFQRWQQDPKMRGEESYVGGDGLDQVTSRNAVPALVELTTFPDSGVRFGATAALRSIGGPDAVAALAGRLYDESSSVRYQAIQGLARELRPSEVGVKDRTGYAPAFKIYEQDPDTPVNNWKRWWEQKGEGKYPSVESMVTKAQRFRSERPWAMSGQGESEPTAP